MVMKLIYGHRTINRRPSGNRPNGLGPIEAPDTPTTRRTTGRIIWSKCVYEFDFKIGN